MNFDDVIDGPSLGGSDEPAAMADPSLVLVKQMLRHMGEDPRREGLRQTPLRFSKAMAELSQGYQLSLAQVIGNGIFSAEDAGPVAVNQVEFFSLCEHHMLPFWGTVSVGYLPAQKIIGLSKIPRIVELYARRLQVQERLTRQVGEGLLEAVAPRAVIVRVKAAHMCMAMRGVRKINSETVTEFHFGLDALSELERSRLINVTTTA